MSEPFRWTRTDERNMKQYGICKHGKPMISTGCQNVSHPCDTPVLIKRKRKKRA